MMEADPFPEICSKDSRSWTVPRVIVIFTARKVSYSKIMTEGEIVATQIRAIWLPTANKGKILP
jgi:hypothetical protein